MRLSNSQFAARFFFLSLCQKKRIETKRNEKTQEETNRNKNKQKEDITEIDLFKK